MAPKKSKKDQTQDDAAKSIDQTNIQTLIAAAEFVESTQTSPPAQPSTSQQSAFQQSASEQSASKPTAPQPTASQPTLPTASQPTLPTAPQPTASQPTAPQPSSRANRQAMADNYQDENTNAVINPVEMPPTPGEWLWLEPADRQTALAQGHNHPIDVTRARSRGVLGVGLGPNNPSVVFVPDYRLYNPNEQPDVAGHWEYFTTEGDQSARAWAWLNFGGQAEYGFENVPHPTAQQIFELRERMVRERRDTEALKDATLAWVPDGEIPASIDIDEDEPETDSDTDDETSVLRVDPMVQNPKPPHYHHDPTNGGQCDQTGHPESRNYRTIKINGKLCTADVSTAVLNRREDHKTFLPNKKGEFRQWLHANKADWTDKKWVKKLNAWRDQCMSRTHFPRKRTEDRDVYNDDQKRYIFDIVDKNGGKAPGTHAIKEITKAFNKRFNEKRTEAAISAFCARMAKMWEKNNGKYVPKKKRGQLKHEEAEERKRKREEEEEQDDENPPKRRKSGRLSTKTKKPEDGKANEDGDDGKGNKGGNADDTPDIEDVDGSENGEGDAEFDGEGEVSDGDEDAAGENDEDI